LAKAFAVVPSQKTEEQKARHREYNRRWYQKNRDKHMAAVNANRKREKREWTEFKSSLSCTSCGIKHPAVIDFHHLVRDDSYQSIHKLIRNGRFTAARAEAAKCLPLCANCHRITHYDEMLEHRQRRQKKRKKHQGS
jgi:hypothetical protein